MAFAKKAREEMTVREIAQSKIETAAFYMPSHPHQRAQSVIEADIYHQNSFLSSSRESNLPDLKHVPSETYRL